MTANRKNKRCCHCKTEPVHHGLVCQDCLRKIRRAMGDANATVPACLDWLTVRWRQSWLGKQLRRNPNLTGGEPLQ